MTQSKQADLAGPGISTYEEVAKVLPEGYESILSPRDTMKALYEIKYPAPGAPKLARRVRAGRHRRTGGPGHRNPGSSGGASGRMHGPVGRSTVRRA